MECLAYLSLKALLGILSKDTPSFEFLECIFFSFLAVFGNAPGLLLALQSGISCGGLGGSDARDLTQVNCPRQALYLLYSHFSLTFWGDGWVIFGPYPTVLRIFSWLCIGGGAICGIRD